MNTARSYFQLGDGFEFVLPMQLPSDGPLPRCAVLAFMASAIYDFETNEWKKYSVTVYDADCVQYLWRSGELKDRRQNFDDLPVLDLDGLRELGYLIQKPESSAYLMNKNEYGKRRAAFIEKVKALPTTINLGVDEEMKALQEEYESREEEQEDNPGWKPPRKTGITYIQLGDGFEFVIDRSFESVNHLLKLSAASVYDMVEKKWVKYRMTLYKAGEQWHSKFIVNEEERKPNLTHVQRLTCDDLVKLGMMLDAGEGNMARYRFDYIAFKRRVAAMNIVHDDANAEIFASRSGINSGYR